MLKHSSNFCFSFGRVCQRWVKTDDKPQSFGVQSVPRLHSFTKVHQTLSTNRRCQQDQNYTTNLSDITSASRPFSETEFWRSWRRATTV